MRPQEQPERAVARCGLARGLTSRAFSLPELAAALTAGPRRAPVWVERDAAGRLAAAGGAAAAAAAARLAPDPPSSTAALRLAAPASGPRLRLAVLVPLAPHDELLLWPDPPLLAAAGVPLLTPAHIRGSAEYRCDVCGGVFSEPNPLKVHLYLGCAAAARAGPRAFLARLLRRLADAEPAPAPAPSPGALEALAAAWGAAARLAAGGHTCLYCGKLYSRKYGLKIHIRTHTGYKPLRCRHCARRFGDPSNLNKHVRLHTAGAGGAGAGRYSCAECGAVLARARDLERHVRARHATLAPAPRAPPD